MQDIEPFYAWRKFYNAAEDPKSPFFGRTYSDYVCENVIYNYYIHPHWDYFGSDTLYIKLLFVDYSMGAAIIEMFGEWNDCLYNDIKFLKRNVIDELGRHGINKYLLIGDNILNFHSSDDSYYEEWFDDIEDGWIIGVNFREHVKKEMSEINLDYYVIMGGIYDDVKWRPANPRKLIEKIEQFLQKRLLP